MPRVQVMELLVHLNKRIKSRPKIQLPVETLLVQYQDPAAASFVTVTSRRPVLLLQPQLGLNKMSEGRNCKNVDFYFKKKMCYRNIADMSSMNSLLIS